MPAFYAHDRFGKEVIRQLKGEAKEIAIKYSNEFSLGLQGPDYLFFYRPLSKNRINQLGYDMHKETASLFLENAIPFLRKQGIRSQGYAYVLGFICHFILDSECHPYVDEMMTYLKLGHLTIEGEFEKYLLAKDNKDAASYRLDKLINDQPLNIAEIQQFYPSLKVDDIASAVKSLKRYKKFLTAPNLIKRNLIVGGLKLTGKYASLKGIMLTPTMNAQCIMSNEGLFHRYEYAIPLAVEMIYDFQDTVLNQKELNKRFDRTFE